MYNFSHPLLLPFFFHPLKVVVGHVDAGKSTLMV